jgi:sec-independent protein translocase protein TatA
MFGLEWPHILLVLAVAFLVFGGRKLPELGKGLGEGLKGFKEGLKGMNEPTPTASTVQQATVAAPQASTPTNPVSASANMEYVTCSRCGSRVENPNGFKVVDFVCRSCQGRG